MVSKASFNPLQLIHKTTSGSEVYSVFTHTRVHLVPQDLRGSKTDLKGLGTTVFLHRHNDPVAGGLAQRSSADAFRGKRISEERKDLVGRITNDQTISIWSSSRDTQKRVNFHKLST